MQETQATYSNSNRFILYGLATIFLQVLSFFRTTKKLRRGYTLKVTNLETTLTIFLSFVFCKCDSLLVQVASEFLPAESYLIAHWRCSFHVVLSVNTRWRRKNGRHYSVVHLFPVANPKWPSLLKLRVLLVCIRVL